MIYRYFIVLLFSFFLPSIQAQTDFESTKKRFLQLNASSSIQITFNDKIFQRILTYSKSKKMQEVSGSFLFYNDLFKKKFKRWDVPVDLRYLAVIESNMNDRAVSPVGALGIWQIMPMTGLDFKMRKDKYVNDWFNPVASAHVAAKYLRMAYKQLKDWNLSILSYNCGVGNVQKAIKSSFQKPSRLHRLNQEQCTFCR